MPHDGPVWHVDGSVELPYGNGGPGAPFYTITQGIAAASSGDTVSVAAGSYVETINYNGKNIAVIGADRETTIIDGNNNGRVVTIDNAESAGTLLKGFTIQNGNAVGEFPDYSGGGIYCGTNTSPTLEDLTIINNTSEREGGGINLSDTEAIIKNVTIMDNYAGSEGGGIAFGGSGAPILSHVLIENNSGNGSGGIYLEGSMAPVIKNCTITGNTDRNTSGGAGGGGIACNRTSHPFLVNSILWDNTPSEITL